MDGHKHTLHTEKFLHLQNEVATKQLWYNFIYSTTFTRTHARTHTV